jgi:hypothetical protein
MVPTSPASDSLSRRRVLTSGLASSAGVAGCAERDAGSATEADATTSGDAPPERTEPSETVQQSDSNRQTLIEAETIDVHDLYVGKDEPRSHDDYRYQGIKARQLVSNEPQYLHVDPASGDDENPGTEDEPVRTIFEALRRIPKYVYHPQRIYLNYGDYSYDNNSDGFQTIRLWHHTITPVSNDRGGLHIVGHDEANPYYDESRSVEDIAFTYGISSGNRGTEELVVKGITIDGRWQAYDDLVWFDNCLFTGGQGQRGQVLDGYKNRLLLWNCTFRDCGEGPQATINSNITMVNCTAENISSEFGSGRPYRAVNGSFIGLKNSDSVVENAEGDPQVDECSFVMGGPYGLKQRLG